MQCFIVAIVLIFQACSTVTDGQNIPESQFGLARYGSQYLFSLEKPNEIAAARTIRCAPCNNERDEGKNDFSNFVDSDYRGNGADNLGYDWSPQAWGGPAFPQKPKGQDKTNDSWNRERGGRQMPGNWGREQRNDGFNCHRCGPDWERDRNRGKPGYDPNQRQNNNFNNDDRTKYYGDETKVTSPQLGIVFREDNRIAYVPSPNGDMRWDGVSGGGMRWDGFSNGVSWSQMKPWDREGWRDASKSNSDYVPSSQRPSGNNNYYRNPSTFRPYDDTTKGSSGWDSSGKGYYFANYPGDSDKNNNKGYASNWQYGNANNMGWDGKDMKWNYGGHQWPQDNRERDRYNPNNFQDRNYGQSGNKMPFGNYYPSPPSGYPNDYRPNQYPTPRPGYPSVPDKNYLPHDREPPKYPTQRPGNYRPPENNRPWNYSPNDRYDKNPSGPYPQPRPDWQRPSYQRPDTTNKYPPNTGYLPQDQHPGYNDRDGPNNYNKQPWQKPSNYGPSRPDSGNNFPYGGNRYPNNPSGGTYPNNRPPPKGYYTGFITEIGQGDLEKYPMHSNYPDNRYPPKDKNPYPDRYGNNDRYPTGNRYPNENQDRFPEKYPDRNQNRYPSNSGYPDKDRYPNYESDRDQQGQYPNRYPGNNENNNYRPENDRYPSSNNYRPDDRYPSNPTNSDYDRGPNPGNDSNNSWNYAQEEHKDGIYRRAGGSYPPYRGGQYYTSSFLASASTPAGSSQSSENKTPNITKPDEVTQPTPGTEEK